ncbi:head-tail connector protein [Enterovirga rhinocerotis]|uniref:Putative phiE125 gp8 family phage protein n=1 Tax=Enterovirga rhinocerotis TaxID=1339210 RepID=A0A4R7BY63_9HYPH|nr:hypothetical protein [Enterovirga rhinocerotis]TDR88956.1 putative phiE125 gp8 family phage protein [Enterovirga rhinocerotis]
MNPIRLAGPAVEPIPLAGMKAYLRLDGDDEDDLVAALVAAGRLTVERLAKIMLIEQTWRWTLPAWPADRVVRLLPFHPVIGIAEIRVAVEAGATPDVLPDTLYRLDTSVDPARLVVSSEAPDLAPTGRIEIDVVCGYGSAPGAVPEPLILAIRRLAAYWFEHRGDPSAADPRPAQVPSLPADALALIAPFRRTRLA